VIAHRVSRFFDPCGPEPVLQPPIRSLSRGTSPLQEILDAGGVDLVAGAKKSVSCQEILDAGGADLVAGAKNRFPARKIWTPAAPIRLLARRIVPCQENLDAGGADQDAAASNRSPARKIWTPAAPIRSLPGAIRTGSGNFR
jgi:hypothetical protein